MKLLRRIDVFLLAVVVVIFCIGMAAIASATDYDVVQALTREMKVQMIAFVGGLAAIVALLFIPYEWYGALKWVAYGISIGLLLLVYVPGIGVARYGALSWIELGPIDVQTSELTKIAYILFLSKFLAEKRGTLSLWDVLLAGATALPIIVLLLLQPDLGSAMVFVFITLGILFVSGLRYWHIALGLAALVAIVPFAYQYLKPHQKVRFEAFLNPNDLSLPGNLQVMRSKITLGSGQMDGKGWFQGVFHKLNYLPVKESDFIFAVYVEEFGYVGGVILLGLYFLLLFRLWYMSVRLKDAFASNIVIGILFMFGFQIFENIAMTMGFMPVTGLTLPFFSAGATSVLANMIAIGLAVAVYAQRPMPHRVEL